MFLSIVSLISQHKDKKNNPLRNQQVEFCFNIVSIKDFEGFNTLQM